MVPRRFVKGRANRPEYEGGGLPGACPEALRITVFLVVQPFRAAEEPPGFEWTIAYFLPIHGVATVPFAGLKPHGCERGQTPYRFQTEACSRTRS
jgi:hypothetical protein